MPRKLQPDNPQRLSNVAETRPIPRGPGTRYVRWTQARDGQDPEIRLAKTGTMRESSGRPNRT